MQPPITNRRFFSLNSKECFLTHITEIILWKCEDLQHVVDWDCDSAMKDQPLPCSRKFFRRKDKVSLQHTGPHHRWGVRRTVGQRSGNLIMKQYLQNMRGPPHSRTQEAILSAEDPTSDFPTRNGEGLVSLLPLAEELLTVDGV